MSRLLLAQRRNARRVLAWRMERHACAVLYGVVFYKCVALSLEAEVEAVIGRWRVVRLRLGAVKVCIEVSLDHAGREEIQQ